MFSQKIEKLSLSVAYGNDNVRPLLKETTALYDTSLEILWYGGNFNGETLPPAPEDMDELFRENTALWQKIKKC